MAFLPSTAYAYLQPFGIRFTGVFPFITNPTTPAVAYAGAVLDQIYPTGSIPATMPLLFLLSIWGTVSAFRPRPVGRLALARIPLLAAAAGTAGVLLWGYIADRYMADFMPFLILAGGIGLIDLWRRFAGRRPRARSYLLGGVALLAAFSVAANVATAIEPNAQFNTYQFRAYLAAQERFSIQSVSSTIRHGANLPYYAPAGQMYEVGNCSGLYYSTGESYADRARATGSTPHVETRGATTRLQSHDSTDDPQPEPSQTGSDSHLWQEHARDRASGRRIMHGCKSKTPAEARSRGRPQPAGSSRSSATTSPGST